MICSPRLRRTRSLPGVDLYLLRQFGFGAANWVAQWYDPKGPYTPEDIADAFFRYLSLGTLKPGEPDMSLAKLHREHQGQRSTSSRHRESRQPRACSSRCSVRPGAASSSSREGHRDTSAAGRARRPLRLAVQARSARDGQAVRGGEGLAVERQRPTSTGRSTSIPMIPSAPLLPDSYVPVKGCRSGRTCRARRRTSSSTRSRAGCCRSSSTASRARCSPPCQVTEAVQCLRRQALRRDAGRWTRAATSRCSTATSTTKLEQALPDQRQPLRDHRRADDRQPLGHEVPRHADHGRGPRARRVRHAATR